MKQSNQESLSALMDGELSREELRFLLRRFDHDESLRDAWSRYHAIRDGLRDEFTITASAGFADRVFDCLDETIERRAPRRRWLQWSAGGAIAAGVATVALMVSQPHSTGEQPAVGASTVAAVQANQTPSPSTPVPSAPVAPSWLTPSTPAWQMAQPASATFYGAGNESSVVMPAAYSRQLAPYMNIRGPMQPTAVRRGNTVRYVLMDPAQPTVRAQ